MKHQVNSAEYYTNIQREVDGGNYLQTTKISH